MESFLLLGKTFLLRPYVFIFLAIALLAATRLMGGRRTAIFFLITWATAFACEFSSTRTGIPFGWYFYNDSTRGQELYLSNVPFMDSLSFSFLLFTSYCVAFLLISPIRGRWSTLTVHDEPAIRRSKSVIGLSALLFMLLDVVIDPVALRGDRWFLGKIYYYPEPGIHFGVPIANYLGWAFVGLVALVVYQHIERQLTPRREEGNIAHKLLVGGALYYGILSFNLAVTFWIGEALIGITGMMMYLPITAMVLLKLAGRLPASAA